MMLGKTLIVAAAFATAAFAADCPSSELLKYLPIASNPALPACTKDSGFSLIPPTGLPTDDQYKKMCVSDNCKNVISIVGGVGPSDCDLNALGVIINVAKLVANFPNECARVIGTPAPTTPAPTSTTPAPTTPAPTSTTPAPTTPAPTSTTPAPTTPAPTSTTPAPTSTTPTPSVKPQC